MQHRTQQYKAVEQLVETEGAEEVGLFQAVDHAADGVTDATGCQQRNGAGGGLGQGAKVKEDRPAHQQIDGGGHPPGQEPEHLDDNAHSGNAPQDQTEDQCLPPGIEGHEHGSVAAGDEQIDHRVVQLAQVVEVGRCAMAEMVDTAGGVKRQSGTAEDQGGQQPQRFPGAFGKIEQHRQGQPNQGQQRPEKVGVAVHRFPCGLK